MRYIVRRGFVLLTAVLTSLFINVAVGTEGSKNDQKKGEVTKLELYLSKDGKAIVDQDGKEIARFVEGTQVQITSKGKKIASQKMQGCWRCYPVCVIWEGKRCVQWMRTCDWDFDCK
jgi:hypothetical protein